MTTRNQWIAETARDYIIHGYRMNGTEFSVKGFDHALSFAKQDAALLEAEGCAPWQTPHPAPTPSVEAEAVAMIRRYMDPDGGYSVGTFMYDARAFLARLDANGGAT